jgi:hypothetical protein
MRGLLHEGLIEQHDVSRWTYYTLKIGNEQQTEQQRAEPTDEERILAHVREHGSISNAECRDLLGVKLQRASYLLNHRLLGFLCSRRCPGDLILRTYDLIRALRDAGVPVVGGFQSPMEKECLELLLRGSRRYRAGALRGAGKRDRTACAGVAGCGQAAVRAGA